MTTKKVIYRLIYTYEDGDGYGSEYTLGIFANKDNPIIERAINFWSTWLGKLSYYGDKRDLYENKHSIFRYKEQPSIEEYINWKKEKFILEKEWLR